MSLHLGAGEACQVACCIGVSRWTGPPVTRDSPGSPQASLWLNPRALCTKAATQPVTSLSGSFVTCIVTLRTPTSQD